VEMVVVHYGMVITGFHLFIIIILIGILTIILSQYMLIHKLL
jgi:hypothetical protein